MSLTWADMFDLDDPGSAGANWSDDDLRAMWRHLLASDVLGTDLSVGDVLHAAGPDAALLDRPASFHAFGDAGASLPSAMTAALVVLRQAARARLHHSAGAEAEVEPATIEQVDLALGQRWLDPASRERLAAFRASLRVADAHEATRARPLPSVAADAGAGASDDAARRGRYRIERPHAAGGLGVLSVARDVDLDRSVALKEIRPELRGDADSRRRFVREAQIAGTLEHPNIVPVYALGRDAAGNPYYAMRFVGGRTLEQAIAEHHRAPTPAGLRDLLRSFGDACRAMAYAHSRGIVHRDLKPLNMMLGDFGETWIVDWGIAKRVTEAEPAAGISGALAVQPLSPSNAQTLVGQSLGTPRYMSPEQRADATRAGPPSDVFSLGAILSQIVTGHPPKPDPQTGVPRPSTASPSRGRLGRRTLGRDVRALEAVAVRAMSVEPSARYPDGGELAADVERWLADEPVRAYREPLLNTLSRWTRRHRAAVVAGVLLLLTSAVVLGVANVRVRGERDEKVQALHDATASADAARRSERVARERLVTTLRLTGDNLMAQGNVVAATARYREAQTVTGELGLTDTGLTCALLNAYIRAPRPLATWSYRPPPVVTPAHPEPDVLLTGDGRVAIFGEADGSIVWRELATGLELARRPGHAGGAYAMALSDDGRTLVTGGHDGTIALWDAREYRERLRVPRAHDAAVRQAAVSRAGDAALTAGDDGRVKWWDVATGRMRNSYASHSTPIEHVERVAFTPDGTGGVAGAHGGRAVVWDLATGVVRRAVQVDAVCSSTTCFLRDESAFVTMGGSGTLGLWNYSAGTLAQPLSSPERLFSSIRPNLAAGLVVGVSHAGAIVSWDLTGRPVHTQLGGPVKALSAGLSDDGTLALTAGNGEIGLWPLGPAADLGLLDGHRGRVMAAAPSRDGLLVASAGWDGTVRVWDVATAREIRRFGAGGGEETADHYWSVAFGDVDRDGRPDTVYAGDDRGTLTAWALATGAERFRVFAHVKDAARPQTTRPTATLTHTDMVTGIALSPDGRTLATSGAEQTVKLWDPATGAHHRTLTGHTNKVRAVTFTPDGRALLSAGYDRVVRIWDTGTWQQVGELAGHRAWVNAVAVSPDGRTSVTGAFDGEMIVWDLPARRVLRSIPAAHQVSTASVAISPDGRTIASCGEDQLVRVWDAASGAEIHQFAHHVAAVKCVAFSADGAKLMSASFDGDVHVLDLTRPAAHERFESEVAAAREALRANPADAAALATLGRWFGFRGRDAVAADLLERTAAAGADVSPLALARHYWRLDQGERARAQFRRALERREADEAYLSLCLEAAGAAARP